MRSSNVPRPPILLRPLNPERDGLFLHEVFGDEASCRYVSHPAFQSVEETIDALVRWTEGAPDTSWSIVEAVDGPALGRISLIDRGRDIWEAACMTVPSARGRNLSTHGLAIAIDRVFAEKGARRIMADIDPDNAASIRVFERLGFQYEGRLRGAWLTHIGERDTLLYGLLRNDPRPWRLPDPPPAC